MKIANKLEGILRSQLKCHVAWLPIANSFELGDYGYVSGGVFTKMGHVKEFGGTFQTQSSPSTSLDFSSADTTKVELLGEAEATILPATAVNASVEYTFNSSESFLIKSATVKVDSVSDLSQLMNGLKKKENWERRFHVVRQRWVAEDALLLCALTAGTKVRIAGDVPALKQIDLGKASLNFAVTSTKELGLKLVGKSGVIGLGFAKFSFLFGSVKVMGASPGATAADQAVKAELTAVSDEQDLVDDL